MNPTSRAARWLSVSAGIALIAGLLGAENARAANQTVKCIIGGRTVYQQQACPANADLPASDAAASAAVKGTSATASAPSRRLSSASRPASSVPASPR